LIERKYSILELHKNLFSDDRGRAIRAFSHLRKAAHNPYILVEEKMSALFIPSTHVLLPELVLDELFRVVHACGAHILWSSGSKQVASRRYLGRMLLHLMLHHALHPPVTTGPPPLPKILRESPPTP
jgi:hypothetical protein